MLEKTVTLTERCLKINIWQTKNETRAAKKEILVKIRRGKGDRLVVSA
jgi:hypothetical protein